MIRTLLICVVLFSTYTAKAETLRILTYNVLLGFNHGKAPEVGAKWIADQKPDIVALQELNGFKQGTLEKSPGSGTMHDPRRRKSSTQKRRERDSIAKATSSHQLYSERWR